MNKPKTNSKKLLSKKVLNSCTNLNDLSRGVKKGVKMEKEGKINSISILAIPFLYLINLLLHFIDSIGTTKDDYCNPSTILKSENFDNLLKNKVEEIKQYAEAEMSLFKFELALASIPKKERTKATNSIKKYRQEKWNKAIKLAKGDEEKALSIYDEI